MIKQINENNQLEVAKFLLQLKEKNGNITSDELTEIIRILVETKDGGIVLHCWGTINDNRQNILKAFSFCREKLLETCKNPGEDKKIPDEIWNQAREELKCMDKTPFHKIWTPEHICEKITMFKGRPFQFLGTTKDPKEDIYFVDCGEGKRHIVFVRGNHPEQWTYDLERVVRDHYKNETPNSIWTQIYDVYAQAEKPVFNHPIEDVNRVFRSTVGKPFEFLGNLEVSPGIKNDVYRVNSDEDNIIIFVHGTDKSSWSYTLENTFLKKGRPENGTHQKKYDFLKEKLGKSNKMEVTKKAFYSRWMPSNLFENIKLVPSGSTLEFMGTADESGNKVDLYLVERPDPQEDFVVYVYGNELDGWSWDEERHVKGYGNKRTKIYLQYMEEKNNTSKKEEQVKMATESKNKSTCPCCKHVADNGYGSWYYCENHSERRDAQGKRTIVRVYNNGRDTDWGDLLDLIASPSDFNSYYTKFWAEHSNKFTKEGVFIMANTIMSTLKSDFAKASTRTTAKKIRTLIMNQIIDQISSEKGLTGKKKASFREHMEMVFNSPWGEAAVSYCLGMGMPMAKSMLPEKTHKILDTLSEEFRVGGVAIVTDQVAEMALMFGPALLNGVKDILVNAAEKEGGVRVELEKNEAETRENSEVERTSDMRRVASAG